MLKNLLRAGRHLARFVLSGLLGALVVVIVMAVVALNDRPDLKVWQRAQRAPREMASAE